MVVPPEITQKGPTTTSEKALHFHLSPRWDAVNSWSKMFDDAESNTPPNATPEEPKGEQTCAKACLIDWLKTNLYFQRQFS